MEGVYLLQGVNPDRRASGVNCSVRSMMGNSNTGTGGKYRSFTYVRQNLGTARFLDNFVAARVGPILTCLTILLRNIGREFGFLEMRRKT